MKRWSAVVALWAGLALAGAAEAARFEIVTVGPLEAGHPFQTIQAAVTAARPVDSTILEIVVSRSDTEYTEDFSLVPGVVIRGEETANTTLSGVISGGSGGTLRNFTVKGTVQLTEGTDETVIENNIFRPRVTDTAVAIIVDTTPPAVDPTVAGGIRIRQNTFHQVSVRGTAIELTVPRTDITIEDNIFVKFTTAVNVLSAAIPSNLTIAGTFFFQNTADVSGATLPAGSNFREDPLFNSTEDLHLSAQSPACQAGAFASDSLVADRTPTPVTPQWSRAGDIVTVFWTPAADCGRARVFRVFAADDAGGTRSLVAGPQSGTSFVVTADNPPPRPPPGPTDPPLQVPDPPTGLTLSPRNESVQVSWTKVTTPVPADGYRVHWTPPAGSVVDVGDVAAFTIEGLQNNVPVSVSVTSYFSDFRFFTVTAADASPTAVGVESRTTAEVKVPVRRLAESDPAAATATETPEELMAVPDLQNNGLCFLQTVSPKSGFRLPLVVVTVAFGLALALRRRRSARAAGLAALVATALLLPSPSPAQPLRAHWVVGVMGGAFEPGTEDWGTTFDHERLPAGKVNIGYRLLSTLELGVEAGYWRAEGEAATTVSGRLVTPAANETLTVIPLQGYALLNFQFTDRQWLVPYAGGGYSRYYFRQAIEGQDDSKGHLDGYHFRGGVKFLLNGLDPASAQRANAYFNLKKTFLALEAQWAKVDDFGDANADLGGVSYYGGLVLEF
ncbi:MAG: fibronectin type III domain-containing protein [Deltaproteobacteria bacterium]|nr:fibronectin type III domain-containing protein [Deltaproteobacteria bacterium]